MLSRVRVGALTRTVTDGLMPVTPLLQSVINAVLICINQSARGDNSFNQWLNRHLFHIFEHTNHDLATPLNHAKNGRFFFFKCATTTGTSQSVPPPLTAFFLLHQDVLYALRRHTLRHIPPLHQEKRRDAFCLRLPGAAESSSEHHPC